MRVIFMGTPDFSIPTLKSTLQAGHEVALVLTRPDRPRGRGKAVRFPPVKEAAARLGLEVFQPERVRDAACIDHLKAFQADVVVVVAFGQILPREILDMPPLGCVNIHASLLPKYRGASPVQWAVINGDRVSGVTAMRMDEGLDTGDIIMQREVSLAAKETAGSLFKKLSEAGARLCVRALASMEDGSASYTPQDDGAATKVGMIDKQFGRIDWGQPARRLECLIRGLNPRPGAYTFTGGKTLKVWDADVLSRGTDMEPGCIAGVTGDAIRVQTGDGILALREVQLEGKRRMPCGVFLRGHPMRGTESFG